MLRNAVTFPRGGSRGGGSLGSDEPPLRLKGPKNFYVHIISPFVNVKIK